MNDSIQNNAINIQLPDSTTELMQEVYSDVAKPAASETGKLLGLVPRAIHAALAPLEKWILNSEYNIEETKILLGQKLANVAPEKITSPEAYVAVPALQAIAYSMNSSELRELYANLLAKSMNIDTKEHVHPAFVEAIKQMSPIDAMIASELLKRPQSPLIDLKRKINKDGHYRLLETNITGFSFASHDAQSASIDNLQKLQFIEIPFDSYITNDWLYNNIFSSEEYMFLRDKHLYCVDEHDPQKKLIRTTSLGRMFFETCIQ